jgi:protein involved in polysaccharide export with SLBB domain
VRESTSGSIQSEQPATHPRHGVTPARPFGFYAPLRTVLTAILLLLGVLAQAQIPTSEQIAIFQSLPPDQQQAILDQIQRGAATGAQTQRSIEFPQTVTPRDPYSTAPVATGSAPTPVGPPRIAPGDSIVIELDVREFPRTLPSSSATPVQLPGTVPAQQPAQQMPATGAPPTAPGATLPQMQPLEPIVRTLEETAKLDAYVTRVRRGNPYRLDPQGRVQLPEMPPIPLSGLTADEATKRLDSDPSLQDFEMHVTLLPLEPIDVDALRPFGYDLFAGAPTTFAPATDVPVPADYVLGPGDTLQVQLLGKQPATYELVVTRDGMIEFPQLGPIAVAGLRFPEAQALIDERVTNQLIGVRSSVSMGPLRSIRVFVLGDAERPGSYTVSGLSTITNALFVSGGVKTIGSLRKIELKRAGKTVRRLDLYDLLLRGDTRADERLQPGDVIFIPAIGPTVAVAGEVNRPAIYELTGPTSAADVIAIAGGLTPRADSQLATAERIGANGIRTDVNLDLRGTGATSRIESGDLIRVPSIRPTYTDSVWIRGHAYRTGPVQFRNGLRITDVIPTVEDLRPNADLHYLLIRREDPVTRRVSAVSVDLLEALSHPQSAANVRLQSRDEIYVFDAEGPRDRIVNPLLDELRLQSDPTQPTQIVAISGSIKSPGQYPLEPGMKVSDLIRAGGGLSESAFASDAELTRYQVVNGERRQTDLVPIDLARLRAGDAGADAPLLPYDVLVIKELPDWSELERVTLRGEVKFPGTYPIKRGETLKSVLERAGGLTNLAFVDGSVFTRKELRDREQRQLQVLSERMQRDLAILALQGSQSSPQAAQQATATLSSGQNLLADLQRTQAVGRLVIDLEKVIGSPEGSSADIILKDGDELVVPKYTQEVTVIGEVPNTTSHVWAPDRTLAYYIQQSGGATKQADEGAIYIIRANGSVVADSGNRWFSHGGTSQVRPGDTIVVPLDVERMRPLPLWTAVTTIIYNLAVAVAAVNSF